MGLDVSVHVITKDFEIVKKGLFDFLPYDFRFAFYFTSIENLYKNSCGDFCDSVYDILDSLGLIDAGWTSLVKVLDVQNFLKYRLNIEPNYITSEMYEIIRRLNPEHILVINGDQYYDNVFVDTNPVLDDCIEDTWFRDNLSTDFSVDQNRYTSNDNDSCVLNTYKNKYNISEDMWPIELERLQTLCNGTTDIHEIANFIETNFL